jgi:hypothetical protein
MASTPAAAAVTARVSRTSPSMDRAPGPAGDALACREKAIGSCPARASARTIADPR